MANAEESLETDDNTEAKNAAAITGLKDAYKLASGSDLNDTTTPETPTTTTIVSTDNTVSVKGELQSGLVVEAAKADAKYDEMFKKAFGDKAYFVYNIKVKGANGYVTTFDKDVTVTVKVPEGIDGAKAGIYYVNDEGSASKIAST